MKYYFFYCFFSLLLYISAPLQAQNNLKMAYVRYDSVWKNTPEYVDFLRYEKELNNKLDNLLNEYDNLLSQYSMCLDIKNRNELNNKLFLIENQIRLLVNANSNDLKNYRKKLQLIAQKRIHQWVQNVAQQQQKDFVFNKDSTMYYFDGKIIDITQEVIAQDTTIYDWVATMPSFEGGHSGLDNYLRENLYSNNKDFEGKDCNHLYVIFVVEKDGAISNLHIELPKGTVKKEYQINFSNMPKWIAGRHNGYAKRVKMILPINIKVKF